MADSYVCSGATMKCTCGDKTTKLTVLPSRTVFLTGQPMANISDHLSMVNLAPFGKCRSLGYPATASATAANHGKLTPMPCMHNTPVPWMSGKNDYIIKGDPALLKSSTCACMWGGTISLVTDGQTNTGGADLSRNQIEEFEKEQEKKNQVDTNSVLDGIQLALDAAGFVPGFGAIPDLLNAAISACRGDWVGAGMSVLAAVPLIGDAAAGAKIAKKGYNAAKSAKVSKTAAGGKNAKKGYSAVKLSEMAKRSVGRNVDVSIKGLVSKGMTKEEAVMFRRAVRNERRNFARKFYEDSGYRKADIDSHLRGIDFKKPVTIENVPPPHTFYQYQSIYEGKFRKGSYYTTDINAKPTDLGIHDNFVFRKNGREFKKFRREITKVKPQKALKSTAYGTTDTWSVPGRSYMTKGGAVQYFMPIH